MFLFLKYNCSLTFALPISTFLGYQVDTDAAGDDENAGVMGFEIPNEADFLVGYASVPGYVSYRSRSTGSWYITTLTNALNRYAAR